MMPQAAYGYVRVTADEEVPQLDEAIRTFARDNNFYVAAVFYENRPRAPHAAYNDLVSSLLTRKRDVHQVIVPSTDHLDQSLVTALEVIASVKVLDASKPAS